jgi:hypothetical protein
MDPWQSEFGSEGKHFVSGNSLFFILVGAAKQRWTGGVQRPIWLVNEPKKMDVGSARPRTRDQNLLVPLISFRRAAACFGNAAYTFSNATIEFFLVRCYLGRKVAATLIF